MGPFCHVHPPPLEVSVVQAVRAVSSDAFDLSGVMERLQKASRAAETAALGLDGIHVHVEAGGIGGTVAFTTWSPRPPHPHHALLAQLHDLARRAFPEGPEQATLDGLHGYLALGAPVDVRPLEKRIRLFGSLSSIHEAHLVDALAQVRADWTLDVRHLNNLAGHLKRLLHAWVAEHPTVAWQHQPEQTAILDRLGVGMASRNLEPTSKPT